MLKVLDAHFRAKEEDGDFAKMDAFEEQALQMILSPHVKKAFDLSQESEKTKDLYGRNRVGQSALLARRSVLTLVDRFVKAGGTYVTGAVQPLSGDGAELKEVRLSSGERIAAVGSAMHADGKTRPDVAGGQHGADRKATAQALGAGENVRLDSFLHVVV